MHVAGLFGQLTSSYKLPSHVTKRHINIVDLLIQDYSRVARAEGLTANPPSRVTYTPLIDMKPSDPDTMLTAMVEAERLTQQIVQDIVVFTCDQQLYRVAVNISWAQPDRFHNMVLRLGGLHFPMSYIGCVGALMAESGLVAFGGVDHMMTSKKCPQNVRALRLLVESVIEKTVQETNDDDALMSCLEESSPNRKALGRWTDKASLSHDAILPS